MLMARSCTPPKNTIPIIIGIDALIGLPKAITQYKYPATNKKDRNTSKKPVYTITSNIKYEKPNMPRSACLT